MRRPAIDHFPRHHRAAWIALDIISLVFIALAAWVSQWQITIEAHNDRSF